MIRPDTYLDALVARAQEVLGPNLFGAYAAGRDAPARDVHPEPAGLHGRVGLG